MRDGEGCTAYVLSESSLFVFERRLILKTCGTTTPLLVLDALAELMIDGKVTTSEKTQASLIKSLSRIVEVLAFTHIDYRFPQRQKYPHRSFSEEVDFIQMRFPGAQEFQPSATLHGRFHLVMWGNDVSLSSGYPLDNLEINDAMMIGISEQSCERFAGDRPGGDDFSDSPGCAGDKNSLDSFGVSRSTPRSVFKELLPKRGSQADEFWFSPCGYSCNAVHGGQYLSTHISPEPESSYASVETSIPFKHMSCQEFRDRIVETFQPTELHVLQILLTQDGTHEDLPSFISSEDNSLVLRQCMQFVGSFYQVHHGYYSRDEISDAAS